MKFQLSNAGCSKQFPGVSCSRKPRRSEGGQPRGRRTQRAAEKRVIQDRQLQERMARGKRKAQKCSSCGLPRKGHPGKTGKHCTINFLSPELSGQASAHGEGAFSLANGGAVVPECGFEVQRNQSRHQLSPTRVLDCDSSDSLTYSPMGGRGRAEMHKFLAMRDNMLPMGVGHGKSPPRDSVDIYSVTSGRRPGPIYQVIDAVGVTDADQEWVPPVDHAGRGNPLVHVVSVGGPEERHGVPQSRVPLSELPVCDNKWDSDRTLKDMPYRDGNNQVRDVRPKVLQQQNRRVCAPVREQTPPARANTHVRDCDRTLQEASVINGNQRQGCLASAPVPELAPSRGNVWDCDRTHIRLKSKSQESHFQALSSEIPPFPYSQDCDRTRLNPRPYSSDAPARNQPESGPLRPGAFARSSGPVRWDNVTSPVYDYGRERRDPDRWPVVNNVANEHLYNVSRGTEHVSHRVSSAALNGEFVEMSELLNSCVDVDELKSTVDNEGNISFKSVKTRKSVIGMYKWLEAWGIYELLLVRAYGFQIFAEMNIYRNFILGLFQKFKAPQVIMYDHKHRLRLAASRSFAFSKLDHDLYITTFDANALRSINKCSKCAATDHGANECPFKSSSGGNDSFRAKRNYSSAASQSQVCQRFQDGTCRFGGKCKYKHACLECGGSEGFKTCSRCRRLLQGNDAASTGAK